MFSWGVNELNQLGVSGDLSLPLSPSLGDDSPPPLPHTPEPQPLWLPPGSPSQQQVLFYLISAGPFTAFAAAVELPHGEAHAAAAGGALEGFFKRVLCRSRSSVGWEQRKLTAATSAAAAAAAPGGCSSAGGSSLPSGGGSAAALRPGEGTYFQRLLTLSRGESNVVGYDATGGPSGGPGAGAEGSLRRQESSAQDADSFFLAGVSVEEVMRLLEGARSTGDFSHLKLLASQVFSDVLRLNSSFAYPGHGSVPDFEGLNAVYAQLPPELLPLVCQSFSFVVSATMKSAQYLKRPDQIKFILFILACTPIFSGFCEEEPEKEDKHRDASGGAMTPTLQHEGSAGGGETRQQQQQREDGRGEMLYTALIHMVFHLPPEGKRSFLRLAKEFPDTIFECADRTGILVSLGSSLLSLWLSKEELSSGVESSDSKCLFSQSEMLPTSGRA